MVHDDADDQSDDREAGPEREPFLWDKAREVEASVAQRERTYDHPVRKRWKFENDSEVNEEKLHEQRGIAHDFDIGADDAAQEPVGRKQGHPGQDAEQGRQDQPDADDAHRVEHADDIGSPERVRALEGQAFTDAETCGALEKREAQIEAALVERTEQVLQEPADGQGDQDDENALG